MKRTSFITLLILFFTLVLPACQENEWADWKLQNEQWLATNKKISGVVTTESGLQYKVLYQGYNLNKKPNKNSLIKVSYTGKLIDGSTFDCDTNAVFYMSSVIEGWKEGIAKMNVKGSYMLYIPSALAYDTISTNSAIPPYSTLIFEVDLVDSYN
ncbi:MAG: FKBP-type peptidyl-prolyl cis-trans isomerase [Paludibacter sp.]|nr:FKBP-type peptidyl-prolyl cis-trans isomerase [Paludibacter sp.]